MEIQKVITMETVIAFIESNLDGKLELDTVAAAVHYSKYYLHRMFTETVGMTIHDYVSRRQLTEAAKLLVFSKKSMQSMKLKENKTMELEKSLNEYLEKIEKYLKPLTVSERVDIVKEIKSEMLELQASGTSAEQIIERLGNPKELAKAYLGEAIEKNSGFSWLAPAECRNCFLQPCWNWWYVCFANYQHWRYHLYGKRRALSDCGYYQTCGPLFGI